MKRYPIAWFALFIAALTLMGCQPVQSPPTSAPSAPTLATFSDPNGFFTVEYPAEWVVHSPLFTDVPMPNAALATNQAIIDASMIDQPLPADQIGVGLMLLPRNLFADAGITAETPLVELVPLILTAMADDPAAVAELVASLDIQSVTLADGTAAVRTTGQGIAEDYLMTFADVGDGIILMTSQIQAVGQHHAELEAQVNAIVDSFQFTGTGDAVMAYVMERMAAMEGAASAPPTVTFTAVEDGDALSYDGPASIAGGLTRIEFVNPGASPHTLWLIKLDEGKTFDDIMTIFAELETNPEFPEWLVWYGGVSAEPGGDAAYIIDLAPGTYSLFSFEENAEGMPDAMRGMVATLIVSDAPEMTAVAPEADLRAELVDFSFIIEGTPRSGPQLVEVANTGAEPHELILLKLADETSIQDALEFMMAGEDATEAPPFEFYGGAGPMAAGLTAWYEVDVPAGTYGMICFVPSPDNEGAPHFMLGMTGQVVVP